MSNLADGDLISPKNVFPACSACSAAEMLYLNDRKAYVPIATCVLEHILFNEKLSEVSRLFYVLSDLIAHIHLSKGNEIREVEKPGDEWGRMLNRNAAYLYQVQKELETKGYFVITRQKFNAQNEVNRIVPTLPSREYLELTKATQQYGTSGLSKNLSAEKRRAALDKNKLFTKLNLEMYKLLLLDEDLTLLQKLIWLYLFARSYRAFVDGEGQGTRKFLITTTQLKNHFKCAASTVSKALKNLEQHGFLSAHAFRMRDKNTTARRKDHSVWELEAFFPSDKMAQLKKQRDRTNIVSINSFEEDFYATPKAAQAVDKSHNCSQNTYEISQNTHPISESRPINNKDLKSNIKKQTLTSLSPTPPLSNELPKDANAKVFSKKTTEAPLLTLPTPKQAREMLAKLPAEKDFDRLIQAGVGEPLAKTQTMLRLAEHEKTQLVPIALSLYQEFRDYKKRQKSGDQPIKLAKQTKFQVVLLREILFPRLREILSASELGKYSNNGHQPKMDPDIGSNFTKKQLPPIDPDLLPYKDLLSLEPESLVGTEKAKQIQYWVYTMRDRNEIKGAAQKLSQSELATQIAFHAKYWKLNKSLEDPIGFAIFVACQKIRSGTWTVPFELAKAREAVWQNQKRL